MTEISKEILLKYVPKRLQYLPEFLQVLYGFLVMTTDYEHTITGEFKYSTGCHLKVGEIANALGWCERFTYRSLGLLWKFAYIDYEGEIFFCKFFPESENI